MTTTFDRYLASVRRWRPTPLPDLATSPLAVLLFDDVVPLEVTARLLQVDIASRRLTPLTSLIGGAPA